MIEPLKELTASILVIGDEITSGTVADTNGSWLARNLSELGFTVLSFSVVRDELDEIVQALSLATGRSAAVFVTGGLGPTSDDITRDAVAKFLGEGLVESLPSVRKLEERYRSRNIPVNPISLRQALFPESAEVLNNSTGTADAFLVTTKTGAFVYSMPGVPREMNVIFQEEIVPRLRTAFVGLKEPTLRFLRFFGLSESAVGQAVENAHLRKDTRVGYRPVFPETFVKLSSPDSSSERMDAEFELALEATGREFFVSDSELASLSSVVLKLLKERSLTVSFAESCSGGLASSLLVSEPGSSAVLLGGVVCYSNSVKIAAVQVSEDTLQRFGAVSAETALELARNIRRINQSSIGVSITGIAGPEGGSEDKPVGTVFFGYSREGKDEAIKHHIPFERNRLRKYSAHLALDLIRRDLLEFPLHFTRR